MNSEFPPVAPGTARPRNAAPWIIGVLLLAAVALAACAWLVLEQWRSASRIETLGQELRQTQAQVKSLSGQGESLRADNRALSDRAAAGDRRLAEVQIALERLAQSQGNVDFALAEVEHLLILAEHSLVLMQDAETARATMQAVERRLEGLHAPGLDAVRGQVAADRMRLEQVPALDLGRWTQEIDALAGQAGTLPLRSAPSEDHAEVVHGSDQAPHGWRGMLQAIWQELRGMVVITRGAPDPALFPAERLLLTQNLLLKLESTRLALLRRDGQALHAAATDAAAWLRRWFDAGDGRVRIAAGQLENLAALDPAPELPDIASSLETLRALIRERAAPPAPVPDIPAAP